MRISDWSSDVCSSDLPHRRGYAHGSPARPAPATRTADVPDPRARSCPFAAAARSPEEPRTWTGGTMSGPIVGEDNNGGCCLAVVGSLAVLLGTSWLLETVLPTAIASTIAWVASVVFLVLVWQFAFKDRKSGVS